MQVYLSSAAKEDPKSDDTILIGPPFYLELKLGGFSLPIQVNVQAVTLLVVLYSIWVCYAYSPAI